MGDVMGIINRWYKDNHPGSAEESVAMLVYFMLNGYHMQPHEIINSLQERMEVVDPEMVDAYKAFIEEMKR